MSIVSNPERSNPLPYQFHGRNFSPHNNLYLQEIMAFHEMHRFLHFVGLQKDQHPYSVSNVSSSTKCECPGFLKCYHILVHDPYLLTAEFAHQIRNDPESPLQITKERFHAGNTSTLSLWRLNYKGNKSNIPLISEVVLSCHIDPTQRRAIPICATMRNAVQRSVSSKSKAEMEEFAALHSKFKMEMSALDGLALETDSLFESRLQIQHTDIDLNIHVNQAVFGKYIENTLCEYCEDFVMGKYLISGITMNFIKEIEVPSRMGADGLPFCVVRICSDYMRSDGHREIKGIIYTDSTLNALYKVTLMLDDGQRMSHILSKL